MSDNVKSDAVKIRLPSTALARGSTTGSTAPRASGC